MRLSYHKYFWISKMLSLSWTSLLILAFSVMFTMQSPSESWRLVTVSYDVWLVFEESYTIFLNVHVCAWAACVHMLMCVYMCMKASNQYPMSLWPLRQDVWLAFGSLAALGWLTMRSKDLSVCFPSAQIMYSLSTQLFQVDSGRSNSSPPTYIMNNLPIETLNCFFNTLPSLPLPKDSSPAFKLVI